jgi:hypothetical protein
MKLNICLPAHAKSKKVQGTFRTSGNPGFSRPAASRLLPYTVAVIISDRFLLVCLSPVVRYSMSEKYLFLCRKLLDMAAFANKTCEMLQHDQITSTKEYTNVGHSSIKRSPLAAAAAASCCCCRLSTILKYLSDSFSANLHLMTGFE